MAKAKDSEFLEFIIKSLVDHPDDVKVDRDVDEMGVLLTLNINPADMGYVIGRGGQNARAIRTLLRIVGARNNARVNMKINEPEGGRRPAGRGPAGRGPARSSVAEDVSVDDLKI